MSPLITIIFTSNAKGLLGIEPRGCKCQIQECQQMQKIRFSEQPPLPPARQCLPRPLREAGGLLSNPDPHLRLGMAGRDAGSPRAPISGPGMPGSLVSSLIYAKSEELCPHTFPLQKGRPGHLLDRKTGKLSPVNPKPG